MSADAALLRELLAAATPGPWRGSHSDWRPARAQTSVEAGESLVASVYAETDSGASANARLIAAAVNALPWLLDELDKLRAERDAARDAQEAPDGPLMTFEVRWDDEGSGVALSAHIAAPELAPLCERCVNALALALNARVGDGVFRAALDKATAQEGPSDG